MDRSPETLRRMLAETALTIAQSSNDAQRLIADAHDEARTLIALMQAGPGSAKCTMRACLREYQQCKSEGNIAAAGWMLAALQACLTDTDIDDAAFLRAIANISAQILALSRSKTLH